MPKIRILPALTSLLLLLASGGTVGSPTAGSQGATELHNIELACNNQLRMRKRRQKAREQQKKENTYAPGQNSRMHA